MKIIPDSIRKLFWDIEKDSLELNKNKRSIIVRTLNYGNLKDWSFLKSKYGRQEILNILNSNRNGVNPRSEKLARLIFN